MVKVSDIRREYDLAKLSEEELDPNALKQFETWMHDAIEMGLKDPTAMTVATVDAEGQPSQRIVLLKEQNEDGFIFYTNLESQKAQDLAQNPKISLHFPWHSIERQVIVYGEVEQLPTAKVLKYFLSRPKESQLAAWASAQSRPVSSRQALMSKFQEMKQRFGQGEITLPKFWGGYLVKPHKIEFWQGGESRLHDRFMYTKTDTGWSIERLMP